MIHTINGLSRKFDGIQEHNKLFFIFLKCDPCLVWKKNALSLIGSHLHLMIITPPFHRS